MPDLVGRGPFVGRERELAALLQRLELARQGEGGIVLVAGEPGVGKTRLLAKFAARARTCDWQVLSGQAYESEGLPPYLPFAEPLRAYLRACPAELLQAQLGEVAPEVALLVPELRRRLPDLAPSPVLSPEYERYRLFEGVTDFLLNVARVGGRGSGIGNDGETEGSPHAAGAAAARAGVAALARPLDGADDPRGVPGPMPDPSDAERTTPVPGPTPDPRPPTPAPGLLLLLDDLHWADTPSLLLLQHLARRLGGAPLLVVLAHRTIDLSRTKPLAETLAELSRAGLVERLLLGPLVPEETALLIAELIDGVASPQVVEAIQRETEGNPFFVREVVRHLLSEGHHLAEPGADAAIADWGIPEGVRQVIGARLAHLEASTNQMLQAAAILGDGLSFDVLAATTGAEWAALTDALDEALEAGMLREAGSGYHFTHALIRQTLAEELSLPRRQRLHLRAAEALEQVHARNLAPLLAALAVHYRLAGAAADRQKVLEYCRRAAEAAAAVFAWEEAAAHWQAVLELLEASEEEQRFELLLALGNAQHLAGDLARATETYQLAAQSARRRGTPAKLADAAVRFSETNGSLVLDIEIELLQEALDALDEGDSSPRAMVLGFLARALYWAGGRGERTARLRRQATEMARRLGDPSTLAFVLEACTRLFLLAPDDAEERYAAGTELVLRATESGDRLRTFRGHQLRFHALLELGEIAAAVPELDACDRLTEGLEQQYRWQAMIPRVALALLEGRFAEGERLTQAALAVGRRQWQQDATVDFQVQTFFFRREQGLFEECETILAELIERGPPPAYRQCVRDMFALICCDLGREPAAREEFERLAAEDLVQLVQDWNPRMDVHPLTHFALLSEVCAFLSDAPRAVTLYDLLAPYATRNVMMPLSNAGLGSASRYLGLLAATLGRWDKAQRDFEAAIAMNERMGARPWLAHTLHDYAAMLLRRGHRAGQPHARELLDRALAIYEEIGMDSWAAKAQVLIDPGMRSVHQGTPGSLSPQSLSPQAGLNDLRRAYPTSVLSPREVEVLRLLASGKSNQQIAGELVISLNTVAHHVASILTKTDSANRTEAAAYAHRHGLS